MNQFQAKYPSLMGNVLTSDPYDGIVLDRTNEVKRAGYRSAQDQIMELTRAGQRLQAAREEKYSVPTGINPRHYGEIDQTVADDKTNALKESINEKRKKAAEEAAERKAAEEAANQVQTPPEGGGVT